jgi:hypothetical protein
VISRPNVGDRSSPSSKDERANDGLPEEAMAIASFPSSLATMTAGEVRIGSREVRVRG